MLLEFCRDIHRLPGRSPSGEPLLVSVSLGDRLIFGGESERKGWLIAVDGMGNRYEVQEAEDVILDHVPPRAAGAVPPKGGRSMAKPTDAETPPTPAEPACGEPAEPAPDRWPEIVFPEPGDEGHLFVTTLEGAILVISRDYYEPGD